MVDSLKNRSLVDQVFASICSSVSSAISSRDLKCEASIEKLEKYSALQEEHLSEEEATQDEHSEQDDNDNKTRAEEETSDYQQHLNYYEEEQDNMNTCNNEEGIVQDELMRSLNKKIATKKFILVDYTADNSNDLTQVLLEAAANISRSNKYATQK
ncbi:hypothetical protein MFLAVUS_005123 [Mucor flavus]|uniref:Uncharacterized protein n=1 Tax=Mucor flavus TaxID=439312 RepID=A0ABP9YXW2_9FUNG